MAKSAAADHGHGHAGSGDEGSDDKRCLVAHAASRVLVNLGAGQVREIDDFAGIQHRGGECAQFAAGHAADDHGHQPGRYLVVGDLVARVRLDEELDLIGR